MVGFDVPVAKIPVVSAILSNSMSGGVPPRSRPPSIVREGNVHQHWYEPDVYHLFPCHYHRPKMTPKYQ
eukprot:scaffold329165_cov56-Attheya_sp.AAC.2